MNVYIYNHARELIIKINKRSSKIKKKGSFSLGSFG